MKIVIASDLYYPMTNGVAVFAHNLAEGLARQGHEVMVLCPSFTGKKHRTKQNGVTTVYMHSMRLPFYPDQISEVPEAKVILGKTLPRIMYRHGLWFAMDPYPAMKKALDKFQPDVIHSQTPGFGVILSAQRYANKRNVPLVSTGHSYPDNLTGQFKLGLLKKPMDATLRPYFMSFLKHAEYATMPTEMAIEDLVPKNRRRFKVPVEPLSNGVDLAKFTPGKPAAKILHKYHLQEKVPRVLFVGRLDPEKSIGNALTAFAGVVEQVPRAEFVIIGDGIDKPHLKDLAKSLGIESQVKSLGRMRAEEIAEVYRSATAFVTASETETQGIVLIEAAASGLPLIAVDKGAVREICRHKKNGILCQPKDIAALTEAMVKILTDEKLQAKYSQASLEIAKTHDLNRTISRFVEIYEEAIRLKGTKKPKRRGLFRLFS